MITTRQQQKQATRDKIITSAYCIYGEMGFAATTSQIAKAAGISHGAVFAHFGTLNDLLECLLQDFGRQISTELHQISQDSHSIADVLQHHLSVLQQYEAFYCRIVTESHMLPTSVLHTLVAIQSTVAFHFQRVMAPACEQGQLKDIQLHMMFNTWMGLVHYYLQNQRFFSPRQSVLKRYQEELVQTFLKLIKK